MHVDHRQRVAYNGQTNLSNNAKNLCLSACLCIFLHGILGQLVSHDYLKNQALSKVPILQVSFL